MNTDLLAKILKCPTLPTLPSNAIEILELCRREDIQLNRLAMTIGKDPALATQLLKTVNSAHYGFRHKVTTISHSVALLGIKTVKNLALSFSLVGSLKDVSGEEYDAAPLWLHSLISATGARSISLRSGKGQPEEAYLAGLLQDVGILALIQALGSPYVNLLKAAGTVSTKLGLLEQKYLDLDHAIVGEALAKEWNLPPVLTRPIRYHEKPEDATGADQATSLAVAFGNKAALPFMDMANPLHLEDYFDSATEWFGLDYSSATEILERAGRIGHQMGESCRLTSDGPELVGQIMAEADKILEEMMARDHKKASGE